MSRLIDIYLLLSVIYMIIEVLAWDSKLRDYYIYKEIEKARYMVRIYDLGMIIFPIAFVAVFVIVVGIILIENLGNINLKFLNKRLFK